MQYNGIGDQHVIPGPRPQQNNARSASYAFRNDPTPPASLSGMSRPSWRSLSANQAPHDGVYLESDEHVKPVTPLPFHRNDVVARHLLVETALLDSENYEVLPIEEVDSLKKEKTQLEARIETARKKLALESKLRDAAQSLHRLYTDKPGESSPQSPKKNRRSLLGDRARSTSGNGPPSANLNQAGDELASISKKVDDLLQILSGLESRRQYVESRLLRHTAAVLQAAYSDEDSRPNGLNIGMSYDDSERTLTQNGKINGYADSMYGNDQMDGFKDVMSNRVNGDANMRQNFRKTAEDDENLNHLQDRLENLNSQMRTLIKQTRNKSSESPESEDTASANPDSGNVIGRLDGQIELIQKNLVLLEQEHNAMKEDHNQIVNETKHQQHSIEGQLEGVNNQLYSLLTGSEAAGNPFDLRPPPGITGHSAQEQLNYLEESILTFEHVLQASADSVQEAQGQASQNLEGIKAKAAEHAEKSSQFETVMLGLWQIISSSDEENVKEPFSLQSFSTRIQHMFDRASHHDEQAEILRRQVQQQRELNNKSDSEKQRELAELQTSHADLQASHADLEDQLLQAHALHAASETETGDARAELINVMNELDRLKEISTTNAEQRQQVVTELNGHKARVQELEETIAEHEAQIADHQDDARMTAAELEAKEQEHKTHISTLSGELAEAIAARETAEASLEELEGEVAGLKSELAFEKANVDIAKGSRAERAKEVALKPEIQAQLSKLEEIASKNATMNTELEQLREQRDSHAKDLQDLTEKHAATQDRSMSLEQQMASLQTQQNSTITDDTRMASLEKELTEMANDYQELTRESIEVEKEREQLETLVDGLRERCETLESQLSDERLRWIGVKSPTGTVNGDSGREMTSTMVLRNEFKKMMRETRAEGARLLRAEQEERRKMETILRSMRRDNLPSKTGLAPR